MTVCLPEAQLRSCLRSSQHKAAACSTSLAILFNSWWGWWLPAEPQSSTQLVAAS
jgi:hypothetical protein